MKELKTAKEFKDAEPGTYLLTEEASAEIARQVARQLERKKVLQPQDIEISTYNSGSAWVPNYNGVRIKHIPSGLVAECAEHRSQHRNKAPGVRRTASQGRRLEADKGRFR